MVRVLISVVERDLPGLGVQHDRGAALLDPLERGLQKAGLCVNDRRQATAADIRPLGSSWGKRLGIPERRPAWLLIATKPGQRPQLRP